MGWDAHRQRLFSWVLAVEAPFSGFFEAGMQAIVELLPPQEPDQPAEVVRHEPGELPGIAFHPALSQEGGATVRVEIRQKEPSFLRRFMYWTEGPRCSGSCGRGGGSNSLPFLLVPYHFADRPVVEGIFRVLKPYWFRRVHSRI